MIRTTNVKKGRVDLTETKCVDEATFIKWNRRLMPKYRDIVLTREAPLGDVGLIRTDEKVFLGQRTMLFRANPDLLDQHFLYYTLLGPTAQAQIRTFGSGSTVEHVRVPDAEKITIPYPDLAIQRKIASILTAYDDLIEVNKRRIALLEKMAEELYREWFVRLRFPGYQDTRFIKGVPEGWEIMPISALCAEIRAGVKKKDMADEEIYIGLEHIPRKSITFKECATADTVDSNKLRFNERDILFGKIRPYLHKVALAHFSGTCSSDTIVLRSHKRLYEGFLLFTVFSETFIELATVASKGTKMPRADWAFLEKLELKIPPSHLLEAFQTKFEELFSLITALLQTNRNAAKTRDLLLPRLISGKLSVEDLDIQYPPSMQDGTEEQESQSKARHV
ncbi:restriction endonuclease subunit S [Idiomarina abyssalis]|uniref:restriction endonuclease subunit S n=1 Tax=Idiomarina abyssalis TaxID=86102 RepID=UPI001CD69A1F|nr:restriction endonuclease subunit S [Idiomarina abyssalis]